MSLLSDNQLGQWHHSIICLQRKGYIISGVQLQMFGSILKPLKSQRQTVSTAAFYTTRTGGKDCFRWNTYCIFTVLLEQFCLNWMVPNLFYPLRGIVSISNCYQSETATVSLSMQCVSSLDVNVVYTQTEQSSPSSETSHWVLMYDIKYWIWC